MKILWIILFCCLVLTALPADIETNAVPIIPEGYSLARYESLWKKSPFTLSSVSEEAAPSQTLVLGGVAKSADDDDVIIVVDKQSLQRFLVSSKGKPVQGISLVSVQVDPKEWSKSSAVIKHNGESITLRFDPQLKQTMATQQQSQMPMGMPPGMRPPMPGQNMPPGMNPGMNPSPNPRTVQPRRVIIPSKPPVTANEPKK